MTTENTENTTPTQENGKRRHCGMRGRRWKPFLAGIVVGILITGGSFAIAAKSWSHRDFHENMSFATDRIADKLDLNDQQTEQLKPIVKQLDQEWQLRRNHMQELRLQAHRVLAADALDPNQVEQTRLALLAEIDQSSQAMTSALMDLSQVLTVEQRQEAARWLQRRHHD